MIPERKEADMDEKCAKTDFNSVAHFISYSIPKMGCF
jgi:hypothetical protein